MMRRSPLKRKTPLKRSRKTLRSASRVRATQLRIYSKNRLAFLRANPWCHLCGEVSTEVHHIKGRLGQLLNDFTNCLAVCFNCHRQIHDRPRWAREQGYLG
jgi:HNH endonuclease